MYKQNLALNNQKELICHKTPPTKQTIASEYDSYWMSHSDIEVQVS